jgi:hypothetical protein
MRIKGTDAAKTSATGTADTVSIVSTGVQTLGSYRQETQGLTMNDIVVMSLTQPGAVLKATITPELAQAMLDTINGENRPLSHARVKQYADVLSRGQYVFNGESIQVGIKDDNKLVLLNGQHRLSACVTAGVSFDTVLVLGLPQSVFSTIDRGKTRSYADVLSVAGYKNTHNIQPAARILVAMEAGFSPTVRSTLNLVTAEDILQYVNKNHDLLQEAHSTASRINSVVGGINSAWVIAYCVMLQERQKAGHSGIEVAQFCHTVETGIGLSFGNPALALRQWFGRGGSKRKGQSGKNVLEAATIIATFNKWVNGEPLQIVRPWAYDSNDFPTVTTAPLSHIAAWHASR